MAKTTTKEDQLPVPTAASHAPPAELAALMEPDKGKSLGLSTAQEDNLVPLIYILQALSPQVMTRNTEYIENAQPGDFWLRNARTPIAKGEEGVLVQPIYFHKDWIEWVPRNRGGGFVARHEKCPDDAVSTTVENRTRLIRPNGNEMVETRNEVVIVNSPDGRLSYALPFSSTGHTAARQWMSIMNRQGGYPAFARLYRLTTRERTNQLGTWFGIDIAEDRWVTPDEYAEGKKLFEAFNAGEKKVEAPVNTGTSSPAAAADRGSMDDEIPF